MSFAESSSESTRYSKKHSIKNNQFIHDLERIWRESFTLPVTKLATELPYAQEYGFDSFNVLRVSVTFELVEELRTQLKVLSAFLREVQPTTVLLRVIYQPHLLTAEAREVHEDFAHTHPQVSTYLPLCLPPSPLGELSRWTTPHQCSSCIFREGGRCEGLGEGLEVEPNMSINSLGSTFEQAGGALAPQWSLRDHHAQTFEPHPQLLSGDQPLCYWWPESDHLSIIAQLFKQTQVQHLWDIGGGNGYLAWLLSRVSEQVNQQRIESVCIDPVAHHYPQLEGVTQRAELVENSLEATRRGELHIPDVLLISWPSPGRSYAKLIEELMPRLIIRATDEAGVCGVRHGHYALRLDRHHATWYELTESRFDSRSTFQSGKWDDLEAPMGYRIHSTHSTWTYRDLRRDPSITQTQTTRINASGILMCLIRA